MKTDRHHDKRTHDQLVAEINWLRRGAIVAEVGRTLRTAIIATAAVAVIYFLSRALLALAGRYIDASIIVSFLSKFEASVAIAWGAAAAGLAYGRIERNLRRDTTERLTTRIAELESAIDPNRTSSSLTVRGDTNPEDR